MDTNNQASLEQTLLEFEAFKAPAQRLSWNSYFFKLCYLVSERSPDAQTKHGAVIVDKENRIISTGYNGFPAGGPDALIASRCDVRDSSIYVTGFPCKSCLLHLVSAGIRKIFCGRTGYQEDMESSHTRAVICLTYGVQTYVHSVSDMDKVELCDPKSWFYRS